MNSSLALVLAACSALMATVLHADTPRHETGTGRLVVEVVGFESDDGRLMASLFASESSWMKVPVQSQSLPITAGRAGWVLEDVAFGEYAVSVVHDENDNGQLDTGLMRIPTEAYGFSNQAEAMFGPASWEDAVFHHRSGTTRIRIELEN